MNGISEAQEFESKYWDIDFEQLSLDEINKFADECSVKVGQFGHDGKVIDTTYYFKDGSSISSIGRTAFSGSPTVGELTTEQRAKIRRDVEEGFIQ